MNVVNNCLLAILLAAEASSGPLTPGTPVKFEDACDQMNEGKRLMVEGYVDFPLSFGAQDKTIVMRVRPSLASWEYTVGAAAAFGQAPNNVEAPPANYKNRDLRLHLDDGQVVTYRNKVKVSGTMYYATGAAPGAYTCALKDTLYQLGSGFQPALPK